MLLKHILPVALSLLCITFYGQEPSSSSPFDFLENKDKMFEVPQSPEVAAFEKYGNLPVNFYAGAPEISIPVFTHKGKEMSLPISLTYDATGIKVNQIATNVGLGWNLNFGGVVSREVKHLPDDLYDFIPHDGGYNMHQLISDSNTRGLVATIKNNNISRIFNQYGPQFPNQTIANQMSIFYTKYKEDAIDLQPDEFNFNVNGLSGKIFINYDNNTAYSVTDPNIKVSFGYGNNSGKQYINKWVLTDANGTVYTFDKVEMTKNKIAEDFPAPWDGHFREFTREFSSAWYLTKIESPNGLDVYELFYNPNPIYWEDNYRVRNDVHTVLAKQNEGQTNYSITPNFAYDNKYQKTQLYLTEIKYNQQTVFTTETANRDDLVEDVSGQKMKRFSRFKTHNVFGNVIQKMDLQHSYFQNQSSQTNNWENSRLKLDGLIIYNLDVTDPKKYAFEYIAPNDIPKITSNATDFWGYYNGVNSNQHQIAKTKNVPTSSFNFANRNPSFFYAQNGTLNRITYPTGGTTTFHYEPHKGFGTSNPNAVNGIVGGLRIFKQESETMDSGNPQTITRLYYYGDANNLTNPASIPSSYTPSGIIHQELMFWKHPIIEYSDHDNENPIYNNNQFYMFSQNNYMQAPNHVAYTYVSEIEFHSGTHNGFTVYEFYNDPIVITPIQDIPFINEKPSNAKLKRKAVYDKNKQIQTEQINTYVDVEEANDEWVGTGYGLTLSENFPGGDKGCPKLSENRFYIELLDVTGICTLGGPSHYFGRSFNDYQIIPYNYISFFWSKLESTIEKNYFTGSSNPVVTTTTNLYNDYRLTSEINKSLSNGETQTTKVFYPKDLVNTGEPDNISLANLANRNSISEPIKVESYRNAIKTGTQRKYFPTSGGGGPGTGPNAILPTKISTSKANLPLEGKVIFHQYDNNGNPVRISYADAPQKYYIWGYNNQLMVGQIENWPDNPPSSALSIISTIIDDSNDPLTTQAHLIGLFASLRNELPNAMVTGFTHKPGVGVSSIIDAKGDVIYYHYDDNNRLEQVNDKYGNLLSENEYNYRINN